MWALIVCPDRTVCIAKFSRGKIYHIHKGSVYSVEPETIWKINGKPGKIEKEHDETVGVWALHNPVPWGLDKKDTENAFKRVATDIWLTRTLEQLAAPKLKLPGKYLFFVLIVLILLGMLLKGG